MDKNDSKVERYREEEAREADREAMGLKIERDGMRARGRVREERDRGKGREKKACVGCGKR